MLFLRLYLRQLTDKHRIANYITERDKHPVNSVEYNQIQEKITVLQSEVE
jgi:hypothetical protein